MAAILTTQPFHIESGLSPEHRKDAALGYYRAFARKLRYPLGPEHKAIGFIERVLDPGHAISAISAQGEFLGVAGFKTTEGALVGGGFRDLVAIYGWIGATLRACLIPLLERDCASDTLLMDGIFVQPEARGQGVGKALLQAVEAHAVSLGLSKVRLDVIDTNPRARALYERQGYAETSVAQLGPLSVVVGFSSAAEMTKEV